MRRHGPRSPAVRRSARTSGNTGTVLPGGALDGPGVLMEAMAPVLTVDTAHTNGSGSGHSVWLNKAVSSRGV
ncbi:hypothetical protein ACGF07_04030 [Kitasatospora sp. NPDC048194]|uniref:hypothetical protein n=1 Tax=Kitasatospora sp. NPDC048194 TaxID=3364045 RepID=UPI0037106138